MNPITLKNVESQIKQTMQLCSDFMTAKILNGPDPTTDEKDDMYAKWYQIGQYCQSLLDFKAKRKTPKRIKYDINLTLMYVTELDRTLDFFDTDNEIIGIDPSLFDPPEPEEENL